MKPRPGSLNPIFDRSSTDPKYLPCPLPTYLWPCVSCCSSSCCCWCCCLLLLLLLTQIRDSIWNEDLWWARPRLLWPRLNCLTAVFRFFASVRRNLFEKRKMFCFENRLRFVRKILLYKGSPELWLLMLQCCSCQLQQIIYFRHQRLLQEQAFQISQLFSSSKSNESGFGLKRSEDYPEDFLVILNHLANLIAAKAL